MNPKERRRAALVRAFGVAALALLLAAAAFYACQWRAWRGTQSSLKGEELTRGSIAALEQDAARQRAELAAQVRALAGKRKALETDLAPLDERSLQTIVLEVLDLASQCGLRMEEVSPVAQPGTLLSLGSANAAVGRRAVIPGDVTAQRPSFRLQCRARFQQVQHFFQKLSTLRRVVIPLEFDVDNTARSAVSSQAAVDDEFSVETRRQEPADGSLRFAVVLSL